MLGLRAIGIFLLCLPLTTAAGDDAKAQVDLLTQADGWRIPEDFTLRARILAMTPAEPSNVEWRTSGEGLGGTVIRGTLGEKLPLQQWSEPVAVKSLLKGKFPGHLFLTVTCGRSGTRRAGVVEGQTKDVELEFEFSFQGKVVKTFSEKGPDGGTCGIVIPAYRLSGGKTPTDSAFLAELCGLKTHAQHRAEQLQALRAEAAPMPKLFSVVTDLGGYGEGAGYGVRHTDKTVVEAECKTLRMLGVNSFAGSPAFLRNAVAARDGFAKDFSRSIYLQLGGYPVPSARKDREIPEAGCPFASGVSARSREMVEKGIAEALKSNVDEVWWRTEDEIGAVADRSPEGKSHLVTCPLCQQGFRSFLKERGIAPGDVGAADWDAVKPVNIFGKEPAAPKEPGDARRAYYTAMFSNDASARLFTPLRDALALLNEQKVAENKTQQPFVYSFALRGNTFLMGGHSLDFFDFYRRADNAFVYETSNRDPRVWEWDSYLCDVGRVVSEHQKIKFGIYVKPHRGAPIQRTLAAVARGAQMIYWYTYGPDYAKGDTFAENMTALQDTARAAELLGKSEEVLYGARWLRLAEVAVVNSRTSEIWSRISGGSPAGYENAKWIYTALQHAHIPVDAIDEGILATDDLSRYKAIYISGSHLTRAAAEKVAAWVRNGGSLFTSGGGLARDEANQPLEPLQALLGLSARSDVELWYRVNAYGATTLEKFDEAKQVLAPAPKDAEITAAAPLAAKFTPAVGREVLQPTAQTKVIAKFADGRPALTCNDVGQGKVWVAGFFPGLEYSVTVRRDAFDMSRDFDPALRGLIAAAALERVKPVVDASQPLVEGLLLKNEKSGKRAVVLINWAYRNEAPERKAARGIVEFKSIRVTLRGAGAVRSALSLATNQQVQVQPGDDTTLILPELKEGDVLLLE
jgi:hypothetical protein